MPQIIKSCFLYHYDPKIYSDKVFNLFLIDHKNGTYSAMSEHGRSKTKLRVLPLIENCSLSLAQNRLAEKRREKVFHQRTPYLETFSCSDSPTLKEFDAVSVHTAQQLPPAKVLEFKQPAQKSSTLPPIEKESGEQQTIQAVEKRKRQTGTLNLDRLDALEF